jgi:hypothetical protein
MGYKTRTVPIFETNKNRWNRPKTVFTVISFGFKNWDSEARGRMYDGLYQRLDTKEGEKNIYRMKAERWRQETSSKLNALRMR